MANRVDLIRRCVLRHLILANTVCSDLSVRRLKVNTAIKFPFSSVSISADFCFYRTILVSYNNPGAATALQVPSHTVSSNHEWGRKIGKMR